MHQRCAAHQPCCPSCATSFCCYARRTTSTQQPVPVRFEPPESGVVQACSAVLGLSSPCKLWPHIIAVGKHDNCAVGKHGEGSLLTTLKLKRLWLWDPCLLQIVSISFH